MDGNLGMLAVGIGLMIAAGTAVAYVLIQIADAIDGGHDLEREEGGDHE